MLYALRALPLLLLFLLFLAPTLFAPTLFALLALDNRRAEIIGLITGILFPFTGIHTALEWGVCAVIIKLPSLNGGRPMLP